VVLSLLFISPKLSFAKGRGPFHLLSSNARTQRFTNYLMLHSDFKIKFKANINARETLNLPY